MQVGLATVSRPGIHRHGFALLQGSCEIKNPSRPASHGGFAFVLRLLLEHVHLGWNREGFPRGREYDSCWVLEVEAACTARAYSLDLRERVIAVVRSGRSRRQVAATFGVEPSTVVKWW